MRLFVALPVPDHVVDHVRTAIAPWWTDERVAWTRPDGWHVTVAFLGEVEHEPDEVVTAVRAGARAAAASTVDLATGRVVPLGRGALALEVHDAPDGAVAGLGVDVQAALAAADLPVTRRPVRPHLTVGRARRRRPVPADLLDDVQVPPTRWRVDRLEVVQSILGRGPATYAPVATVGLSSDAG